MALTDFIGPALTANNLVEVLSAPADEGVEMGKKAAAEVGQGVFDTRRNLGVDFARNEAVGFKALQGVAQHLGRDVGQSAAYLGKAGGLVLGEHADHEHRPLA